MDTASTQAETASFGTLKKIDAGLLAVGYAEAGPAEGPSVILLHGWPYDIHSYVDVVPLLAAQGYRVIVPYLRGYGTTRFLSDDTLRNGQQSVLAVDTIALMDALEIDKAIVAGFDWGARTQGEAQYDDLEKRLVEAPVITVPTITLEGDANGAPHPDPSSYAGKFSGRYSHRTIEGGIGHNRRAPDRGGKRLQGQRPDHRARSAPVSAGRRRADGCRVRDRPGEVSRRVRRRPPG